ncbi:hypothetical protein KCG53_10640 [Neisseria subflava]|uniref:Uncharacterized protein n=1 Tax=Neisseria subflava TaxID=28449 RepID=A0A9X9N6S8_NEISU|nr:hypothetical protein KCG53_10640 [Neisseria subflava]
MESHQTEQGRRTQVHEYPGVMILMLKTWD